MRKLFSKQFQKHKRKKQAQPHKYIPKPYLYHVIDQSKYTGKSNIKGTGKTLLPWRLKDRE